MAKARFDYKVLLLAVAVGAISGGLGAWSSRATPPAPKAAAAEPSPAPIEEEPGSEGVARGRAAAVGAPAPTVELSSLCGERPVSAAVRVRRLDETPNRTGWAEAWRGKTGPDGRAELTLAPATYALTASGECGAAQRSLVVRAGEPRRQVTLTLGAGRVLQGQVVDAASGNAVPGALLSARALVKVAERQSEPLVEEEAVTATADSFGRFRLEAVGEQLLLKATALGYGDGELELGEADATHELVVKLEHACMLAGKVSGGDGVVTLTGRSGTSQSTAFANPDGSFRLEVPPGDVQVVARSASGLTALTRFPLGRDCARSPLELTLGPPLTISGRALDESSGKPVSCARVWARTDADAYELAAAQAGPDGSFALEGLPAGSYWVLASCPTGERGDQLHVEPPAKIELHLRGAASLAGRVVDGVGQPVAGARVTATPTGAAGFEAVTDPAGEFLLERLPPVAIWVDARAGAQASEDEEVQLNPGVRERVELKVETVAVVKGRVKGTLPEKMWVVASRRGSAGGGRGAVTADGSYRIEVSPGTYAVFRVVPGRDTISPERFVTVEAGQEVEVDFDQASAGRAHPFSSVAPGEIGVAFDRSPGGLAITWVAADGPAYAAGVREGDLLLTIDGQPLDDTLEAYRLARGEPGSKLKLQVRHGGRDATYALTREPANDPFH